MSDISNDLALFNELVEGLINEEEKNPVAERIDSNKLYDAIDLSLNESAMIDDDFKTVLRNVLIATPKTATNLFFNQLFGGRQSKAVLGDLLAVMLNNSMYTYKVAGPQVGIEQEIIRQSCKLIGYGSQSNGTFPKKGKCFRKINQTRNRNHKWYFRWFEL